MKTNLTLTEIINPHYPPNLTSHNHPENKRKSNPRDHSSRRYHPNPKPNTELTGGRANRQIRNQITAQSPREIRHSAVRRPQQQPLHSMPKDLAYLRLYVSV